MLRPTAYCQLHLEEHVVVADVRILAWRRSMSIFSRISQFCHLPSRYMSLDFKV